MQMLSFKLIGIPSMALKAESVILLLSLASACSCKSLAKERKKSQSFECNLMFFKTCSIDFTDENDLSLKKEEKLAILSGNTCAKQPP